MGEDWIKVMGELDDQMADLVERVAQHDERDNERFAELTTAIRELGEDLKAFRTTVTEAIVGRDETPGIRERLRNLERTEQDRKWALRILWTAVISEGIVLVFRILTSGNLSS